ncbi:MAG: hypothetical protein WCE54_13510 [Ignavibacteriaceae bacterium]
MLIHKFFLFFVFATAIIIPGCAHSYAPRNWLPDTDHIQTEAFGGWLSIEYNIEGKETIKVKGEYITSDTVNVYILDDSLFIIPKIKITDAILEIDDKNTSQYSGWTTLGTISTLSHGLLLVFTFPTWLATGIIASSGESFRDRYSESDPANEYWDQIIKFARFPQGLPENINPKALRRKEIYTR